MVIGIDFHLEHVELGSRRAFVCHVAWFATVEAMVVVPEKVILFLGESGESGMKVVDSHGSATIVGEGVGVGWMKGWCVEWKSHLEACRAELHVRPGSW